MNQKHVEVEQSDRAGKSYWSSQWSGRRLPKPLDPSSISPRRYVAQAFHRAFVRAFDGRSTAGQRVLEIGCGRSIWLPYLAKHHGFRVAGLDYSEVGCAQTRAILAASGVEGEIHHGDLFSPATPLVGAFDAVISLGVVEHFDDTAGVLRACSRFLRPGGRMVTLIPNLKGLGSVLKYLDRKTYDIHVPLDAVALSGAHQRGGLEVRWCEYLLPLDLCLLSVDSTSRVVKTSFALACFAASTPWWLLDSMGLAPRPNPVSSPYIVCVADMPLAPPSAVAG